MVGVLHMTMYHQSVFEDDTKTSDYKDIHQRVAHFCVLLLKQTYLCVCVSAWGRPHVCMCENEFLMYQSHGRGL